MFVPRLVLPFWLMRPLWHLDVMPISFALNIDLKKISLEFRRWLVYKDFF